MTCAEAKLKLEPCVSGTLSPEERIELEEHLAICEGCRLELELTRAVMGAPSFEVPDESPSAAPEAPPSDSPAPEAPPDVPQHQEPRAPTAVYDEVSFADLAESSSAGSTVGEPPAAAGKDSGPSEPDPFANFTAKPAESTSATWDFEPAEGPRDSSPPEGSLSFANEALKRKREVEERRKATIVRIALWGGGIGCGVLLLGISVWIALAFRQDKAPEFAPSGVTPSGTPQTETATPAPPESMVTPNTSDGGAVVPPPATVEPTTPAPMPSSEAPASTAPTILNATPGVAASPGPPPPGKSGTKAKPGAKGAGKTPSGATARKGGSTGDDGEFPWKPVDDPPIVRSSAGRTGGGPASGAGPTSPTPGLVAPRAGEPETAPPPHPAPVNPPNAVAPDQGTAPNAGSAAPASSSPQPADEPAPQSPAPAVTKPIDRLHVATETAAKNADLAALRKLKSSWKSLVGSTAGPDRTRAKLEYADCLWSIQEISGRNSDRRDALTAYRDYVLYAPAGGTNSRTISRMRFLEDILTDK